MPALSLFGGPAVDLLDSIAQAGPGSPCTEQAGWLAGLAGLAGLVGWLTVG